MPRCQLTEEVRGQVRARRGSDFARSERSERGGPAPTLEYRSFTEDGSGPNLCHRRAIDLDCEHAIEEQIHVGSQCSLLHKRGVLLDGVDSRLGTAAHDPHRQFALERRLDLGHERR
jgi:hypothetical protein